MSTDTIKNTITCMWCKRPKNPPTNVQFWGTNISWTTLARWITVTACVMTWEKIKTLASTLRKRIVAIKITHSKKLTSCTTLLLATQDFSHFAGKLNVLEGKAANLSKLNGPCQQDRQKNNSLYVELDTKRWFCLQIKGSVVALAVFTCL